MRPRNYDQDYNTKGNVRKYLVGKRRMVIDDLDGHRPQRACRLSVRTGIDYMTSDDDIYDGEEKEERPIRSRQMRARYYSSDDEPMFTPPTQTRRLRTSTITSRDSGIRRSQRQRKLKYENCNDSWIFGSQSLRGYPSLAHQVKKEEPIEVDEEEEEEEEEDGGEEEVEPQEKPEEEKEVKKKTEKRPTQEIKKESSDDEDKEESYRGNDQPQSDKSEEESSDEDMPRRRMRTRNNKNRKVKINYSLRKKKPTVQRFQITAPSSSRLREMITRSIRRKRRHSSSSSSSSSSDEEGGMKKGRYERERDRNRDRDRDRDRKHGKRLELAGKSTGKLADVDPISLDQSIRFSNIGGLEKHVDCLKEMILFPILYPEIFSKFNVAPPKGVLFHGPPGTGKTLMARALANECSIGGRKVSFFMRKGADCLSKWVGESERQLRILFQEAHEGRPSIIFFDELDGLAPVRSSKQDQIHASIVCTLLALMDGLDNRGDIIVIGATNRIDSIDPALRRPGRFDRELHFPLPGVKERLEILGIHASWAEPGVLNKMAETTAGYCGSDLKHLATEAVIQSLKRIYPQIYGSNKKLLLDVDKVKVTSTDFESAQRSIIPASQRGMYTLGRKLPLYLEPLLSQPLAKLLEYVGDVFPTAFNRHSTIRVRRPSLLVIGEHKEVTFLATALLYKLEHCPTMSVSFETLFSDSSRSPEETLTKVFKELPHSSGSILWFGDISLWWGNVTDTVKAVLNSLLSLLDPSLPIFFVATSTEEPPPDLNIFSDSRNEIFRVSNPTKEMRENFFRPLFRLRSLKKPPVSKKERVLEQLPEAPPTPPPKLTKEQIENLYKGEENTLRELRIFLRQTCAKLARNKQFYMFSKPVDTNEVPDYLQVIKEPMDLETMMTKIDLHKYTCAEDFLKDIDMICANALEYNPDRDPADKLIRHRACYLRDTAYALIKTEMDSDFEVTCRNIRNARKNRDEEETKENEETKEKDETVVEEKKPVKRRRNAWSKGIVKKAKRSAEVSSSPKKIENSIVENGVESSIDGDHHDESFTSQEEVRTVTVDRTRLDQLFQKTIQATEPDRTGFDNLVDLYSTIAGLIDSYSDSWDRTKMPDDLEKELDKFVQRKEIK